MIIIIVVAITICRRGRFGVIFFYHNKIHMDRLPSIGTFKFFMRFHMFGEIKKRFCAQLFMLISTEFLDDVNTEIQAGDLNMIYYVHNMNVTNITRSPQNIQIFLVQ